MSRFRYLLAAAFLTLLVWPGTAAATHNADSHSPNMSMLWSLPEAPSRTHSDVAIWGNIGVSGNYDGFRIFNVQTGALIVNFPCRGPQNDVSLWEHNGRLLLFQSVDTPQTNGTLYCSPVRSSDTTACGPACFEGIRIFDITPATVPQPVSNPYYIKGVYTDCGSHTHTLVPDLDDNRVLLYISSAPGSSGPNCQSPHNKISIVSVPLDAPRDRERDRAAHDHRPAVRLSPRVPRHHRLPGHQQGRRRLPEQGQLWDITNPAVPDTQNAQIIDTLTPPLVNYWHSAAFTWDGQYVVFMDESFTGRCAPGQDGKIRIYRVADGQLMSTYMIPRNQGTAYCSVHNGNIIPVSDRYLLVAAWYAGGTSVIDFTNPSAPVEIGYYDAVVGRGPADTWSSYWYNGKIYANDIVRGVDAFEFTPVPAGVTWNHLNAQTQMGNTLPPPPIGSITPVARLIAPPVQNAQPGPGGVRPARAVKRSRATARARGSLLRARARSSKRR